MALMTVRDFSQTVLRSNQNDNDIIHIFEPEFHQEVYVEACETTRRLPGAFQVGDPKLLEMPICRGVQPEYADAEDDEIPVLYEGMILYDGSRLY